jgi:tRNA threonylcarbamoyladenosine biosynthesis protein TsaB
MARLCHAEKVMTHSRPASAQHGDARSTSALLLAIDTCGPTGSVALGRLGQGVLEPLDQIELEGRSYSSTLIASVAELLSRAAAQLKDLSGIVAVHGPGSFTGVRVGLSAVKGLAEASKIPVVAFSRLEVLAHHTQAPSAALDAHRNELFLRIASADQPAQELLAGADELALLALRPAQIALCDDAAAALITAAWPSVELLRSAPPTAANALALCAERIAGGSITDLKLVDLAELDGHYLRRPDAEINADQPRAPQSEQLRA